MHFGNQHLHILAQYFIPTVTPEFFGRRIEESNAIVLVDGHHTVDRLLQSLTDDFFGALLRRHIFHKRGINDFSGELNLGQRQASPNHRAIIAHDLHLAAATDNTVLARRPVCMNKLIMLVAVHIWHQHIHILAKHFFATVTPEFFGGGIKKRDFIVFINGDHPVNGLLKCLVNNFAALALTGNVFHKRGVMNI